MVGATSRSLSLEGLKEMTIGQIVDYCETWNKAHDYEDEGSKNKTRKRKATQMDWDAFLG